jgi:outer membrane receptor for ferrienterochelin and colicin
MSAYVMLKALDRMDEIKGAITNQAGFYSVTVEKGKYAVVVSVLGYKEWRDTLYLQKNITLNIDIELAPIQVDEVVVSGQRNDKNVSSVEVGKMEMTIENIKAMPALFGEADVLKAIQLLPGVQSGGEGNSGFYVRGGGADQNLLLLDEATVYNASHLFGFFSVFNAQAVKDIELYKSGIPAQYGGRLSSILDVHQKEGNMKKYEVDGGIGVIFSRITVQGPIKKNKASFIVSGRRTYADWIIQPFLKKESPMKGMKFYFYDLNAKINWIVNDKHRLYLGGYYGKDVYGFKSSNGKMNAQMNWGNAAASFRWNYIINSQLFLNTSATFSNYDFGTSIGMDVYGFSLKSGVMDAGLKTELTYMPAIPHTFRFGVDYIFHRFNPNTYNIDAGESNSFSMPKSTAYYAHELSIYVNDEFDITKWLKVNLGLRYSHFEHIGAFIRYLLDESGIPEDSIVYKPGQIIQQYNRLEPRISARFGITKNFSIKTAFTMNAQHLHQVSMASISLPTDVWMPSTDLMKPQQGFQYSLGFFYNFNKNMFETYIDLYYKDMKNLVEYRDGIDLSAVKVNPDQLYIFGNGYSYGAEFYFKKAIGKVTGFIGYTLAFTVRDFPDLNNGKQFYAKYDRRHDVSVNISYEIIRHKLSVAAVWVFSSGNTMTIPTGLYFYGGTMITEYSDRNAYRMPPYHRLDLSLDWTIVKKKKFETGLNFSVYNVYNRQNPFFIYIDTEVTMNPDSYLPSITMQGKQMSLFPILPSITWNFKF